MRVTKLFFGLLAAFAWMAFAFSPRAAAPARASGPPALDPAGFEVTELGGSVLTASDRLGLPGAVERVGEYLVLTDGLGEAALHVVDRRTGEVRSSFGRNGEGPGEYRAPRSIDAEPGGDAFWVFDIGLQRLTRVELREGLPARRPADSPVLTLRASAPTTDPIRLAGGHLLALGFYPDGRLAEFDARGTLLRSVGPLPPNPSGVPPSVLQQAYLGRMKARPDRSLLAVGARYAGEIEIYRADGTLLHRVSGPSPVEPRFAVQETSHGPAMASGDDLRFAYLDVAATRERIYALFSGRTRGGFPGEANYGEYVHVFDWEGRFLEAFRLDADAIAIAADESEGRLYAVRHLPTPAVVEYRLPSMTLAGR
ncbi:MAG: BF3164 family lipoprotein [Gemmatimonadota bacterium]